MLLIMLQHLHDTSNKFRSTFYIRSIREPLRTLGAAVVYSCGTRAQQLKPPPRIPTALCSCLLRADFVAVLTAAQLARSSSKYYEIY